MTFWIYLFTSSFFFFLEERETEYDKAEHIAIIYFNLQ